MWDDTDLKPPTPPLHRFPSWESRIYQVANEGLSVASGNEEDDVNRTVTSSQGYCDINVPVYTIVKGNYNIDNNANRHSRKLEPKNNEETLNWV
jgi:hypothetical protein